MEEPTSKEPLLAPERKVSLYKPLAKGAWRQELKVLMQLALPIIVSCCSSQTMVVTDQVFVGHLGVTQLAAAALGNTWFNLLWFFLLGTSTALDTLGSQSYGANDYTSLLTWTVAATFVLSGLCGIMAVALWFSREVAVHLFFQPDEVADAVSVFCRYLIPGLWSVVLMKFMQVQNCMLAPALVAGFTCLFNIGNNALLVHYYGFVGAPIATTISRFLQFFIYVAVVAYLQNKAHPGQSKRFLRRLSRSSAQACTPKVLWLFCQLGLPGGAMLALEAGSFEVTTTFAGGAGHHPRRSPLGPARQLRPPLWPTPAALASRLAIMCGTVFQASAGVLMLFVRKDIARLFTNDERVIAVTSGIAIFGVGFQFFDGAFGCAQGVLRGCGRQTQLMFYNLFGFWGIGVAFGWYLTFRAEIFGKGPLGLVGLWIGIDSGDFVSMAMCVTTVCFVNWPREAALAQGRMEEGPVGLARVSHVSHVSLTPRRSHLRSAHASAQLTPPHSSHLCTAHSSAAHHKTRSRHEPLDPDTGVLARKAGDVPDRGGGGCWGPRCDVQGGGHTDGRGLDPCTTHRPSLPATAPPLPTRSLPHSCCWCPCEQPTTTPRQRPSATWPASWTSPETSWCHARARAPSTGASPAADPPSNIFGSPRFGSPMFRGV
ncbi:MAG: hypothetical protein WDW36_002834 [Sanguina aurantia]